MGKAAILLVFLSITLSCNTHRDQAECSKSREMLKEYFLYSCLHHGYPQMELAKLDYSSAVYVELSNYAPQVYRKVDSLAKDFVSKIGYEDTYYKSKEFDDFIRSLDEYMAD